MPITNKQEERRKKYLGSSDAPALVGVNPWQTAADIYHQKVSELEPQADTDVQKIGKLLEDSVLNWFAKETGKKIVKNQFRVHKNKILAANLDATIPDSPEESVEAKTTGILWNFDREKWGEVETDEVPEHVAIQAQHQMAVVESIQVVHIPVLLGGVGFRMYHVERDNSLIKDLVAIEEDFWKNFVVKKQTPPDTLPGLETLKRIKREPGKMAVIDQKLVDEWMLLNDLKNSTTKSEALAKRRMLNALGDAEGAEVEGGMITYFEQKRAAYQVDETTYRVARFKKAKKEKK